MFAHLDCVFQHLRGLGEVCGPEDGRGALDAVGSNLSLLQLSRLEPLSYFLHGLPELLVELLQKLFQEFFVVVALRGVERGKLASEKEPNQTKPKKRCVRKWGVWGGGGARTGSFQPCLPALWACLRGKGKPRVQRWETWRAEGSPGLDSLKGTETPATFCLEKARTSLWGLITNNFQFGNKSASNTTCLLLDTGVTFLVFGSFLWNSVQVQVQARIPLVQDEKNRGENPNHLLKFDLWGK